MRYVDAYLGGRKWGGGLSSCSGLPDFSLLNIGTYIDHVKKKACIL